MSSFQEDAKVFKALCDPKRLAILEQLRPAGTNGSDPVRAVLPHEDPV